MKKSKKTHKKFYILGYRCFYDPQCPLANKAGIVYYHRYILSQNIGRWLRKEEHVHHIDENKKNNRIRNLKITNKTEHIYIHRGHRKTISCCVCSKNTTNKRFCSHKCSKIGMRKVLCPHKTKLRKLLKMHTFIDIGKMFGVSDNSIRKWLKS